MPMSLLLMIIAGTIVLYVLIKTGILGFIFSFVFRSIGTILKVVFTFIVLALIVSFIIYQFRPDLFSFLHFPVEAVGR